MTKTTENSPMILPWLAHRARVSDSRAAALWADARRHAASLTGEDSGSRYWGVTQRIVLELLRAERWRSCPPPAWPWLLLQDGVERWSDLTRYWLVPAASASPLWETGIGRSPKAARKPQRGSAIDLSRLPRACRSPAAGQAQ